MIRFFQIKKIWLVRSIFFGLFIFLATPYSAWAWGTVTISTNLTVTPSHIPFETVFPEEVLFRPLFVSLSNSFLANPLLDDVEYHIEQRVKPKVSADALYCKINPKDYTRCYPTLCPYLSKEADKTPLNDTSVPAFHDPNALTSIALGRLAKSDNDLADNWTIDLHVPCFMGQCAQDNVVPIIYELDPSLHGQVFGCDLVVEVLSISSIPSLPLKSVSTDQFTLRQKSYPHMADDQFAEAAEFTLISGAAINPATELVTLQFNTEPADTTFSRLKIMPGSFKSSGGGKIQSFSGLLTDEITGKQLTATVRIVRQTLTGLHLITLNTKNGDYIALEGLNHQRIRFSLIIGDDSFVGDQCFQRTSDGDLYFPARAGIICQ